MVISRVSMVELVDVIYLVVLVAFHLNTTTVIWACLEPIFNLFVV